MPWEVVKQSDGNYARFSTVVMGNTHHNLSREQMIRALTEYQLTEDEARAMIDRAALGMNIRGAWQSGRL